MLESKKPVLGGWEPLSCGIANSVGRSVWGQSEDPAADALASSLLVVDTSDSK